jgi:glycosyltransferase involved in cell wall biosynthesis
MTQVVYISMDGALSHIGYSQVVRLVESLARRGVSISLVSLERHRDLQQPDRVAEIHRRLDRVDAEWIYGTYEEGGTGQAAIRNLTALARLAWRQSRERGRTILHARGYHGALAARAVAMHGRHAWIFDARGAWIDERLEEGRWFSSPVARAAARAIECDLYRRADSVVLLTELHRERVARIRSHTARDTYVIPTCADFESFRPYVEAPGYAGLRERLGGGFLVGIVGSMNRAYRPRETARLARLLTEIRGDCRICVLSSHHEDWTACLTAAGVPKAKIVAREVSHAEMPAYLSALHCVLMLLEPYSAGKIGAMPTKLAECFAAEVTVCAFGGNSEILGWVERTRGGVVLSRLEDDALVAAAQRLASSPHQPGARERARTHFSLDSGSERYCRLYESLGGQRA